MGFELQEDQTSSQFARNSSKSFNKKEMNRKCLVILIIIDGNMTSSVTISAGLSCRHTFEINKDVNVISEVLKKDFGKK